ncbi:MAG: hypothetical protein HYS05_06065 [Acidobacteria bacterium]|nr:hypothetical protein [Acidobacteriota bacterium]
MIGLIEAHRSLQDRVEAVIDIVKERLGRWAGPKGFVVDADARNSEIFAWPTNWADKRRGPRVRLVVGGFCPLGFRKVEADYPYLSVYTDTLEDFRVKEPERRAFGQALRSALGDQAESWEAHDVDDSCEPLGRYLTQYNNVARARLIADPDAVFNFCVEHFPALFGLVPIIQTELDKLGR